MILYKIIKANCIIMNDEKACDINTVLIYVHFMIVTPGGARPPSLNIGGATGPPFPIPLSITYIL